MHARATYSEFLLHGFTPSETTGHGASPDTGVCMYNVRVISAREEVSVTVVPAPNRTNLSLYPCLRRVTFWSRQSSSSCGLFIVCLESSRYCSTFAPFVLLCHSLSGYQMGDKDKKADGSTSASPGQWQRRQRRRTSSPEQIPQQPRGSISALSAHHPAAASKDDRSTATPKAVRAGVLTGPQSTGSRQSRPGGIIEHRSRVATGSQGRPTGPANQQTASLATSRSSPPPRGKTQQQSAGASSSQMQRAGSARPQPISPARSGQRPAPNRRTSQPQSSGAGGSQAKPAPSTQTLTPRPARDGSSVAGNQRRLDPSTDADGLQFRPGLVSGTISLPLARTVQWPRFRHQAAKIGIGIETEFFLETRFRPMCPITSVTIFGEVVATNHNIQVPTHLPRMYSYMENQEISNRGDHICAELRELDEWSLTFDGTMYTNEEPCKLLLLQPIPTSIGGCISLLYMTKKTYPGGLEMKSPIFVAYPASPWRSRLLETWRYLQNNYKITGNEECGTHFHISVEGGYAFEELKQIAMAALYFEPAFDALVPLHRTGGKCRYAQNLWLEADHLALDNRSRLDSCTYIERMPDFKTFLNNINAETKWYSWNFRSIGVFHTVEFRKPPACTTADETLAWAEIAMAFTQSSIRYGILDILRTIPSTVGGLRSFLEKSCVKEMSEHARFEVVFRGKDPNAFVESLPRRVAWTSERMWAKYQRKAKADRERILSRKRIAEQPYL